MRASKSWRSFKRLFDRAFPQLAEKEDPSGVREQIDVADDISRVE